MSKNGITLLVVIVAIVGGGYWLLTSKTINVEKSAGNPTDRMTTDDVSKIDSVDNSKTTTSDSQKLSDVMAAGKDVVCTFTSSDPNAENSGTVFVSGKDVRGDFASDVKTVSMKIESHMIQKDGYVYTWTNTMPQGFKAKVVMAQDSGNAMATGKMSGSQSFDFNTSYNYNCKDWQKDTSKFTLPSSIIFSEIPSVK